MLMLQGGNVTGNNLSTDLVSYLICVSGVHNTSQ